jgi:putative NADH-flavin reductase
MKLLILGATGATGQHLVEQALAEGHEVTAIVRDPSKVTTKHERLRLVKGRATEQAELEPAVAGQDAVLSAIGPRSSKDPVCAEAAVATVRAMKKQGVERVIWLSASGVGDSRDTAVDASFVFGRIIMPLFLKHPYANHARAEEALRASGLKWTVLRPLQLVDKPTGKPATATLPGVRPGALKIARKDVASFMLKELATGAHVGQMPLLWT